MESRIKALSWSNVYKFDPKIIQTDMSNVSLKKIEVCESMANKYISQYLNKCERREYFPTVEQERLM